MKQNHKSESISQELSTNREVRHIGVDADNNAATRSNGHASVLSQYPDPKLVGQEVANWNTREARDKTQTLIAALKQAGRTDVIVGGFDDSPDAAAAVADGSMA